jgi:hypothetical protein
MRQKSNLNQLSRKAKVPAHPEREAVEGFSTLTPAPNPARDNL